MNDSLANFYEFFYYPDSGFMNLVYDEGLYGTLFFTQQAVSALFMALFYYIIAKPSWGKLPWFLMGLSVLVLNAIFAYIYFYYIIAKPSWGKLPWFLMGLSVLVLNAIFAYIYTFATANAVVEPGTFSTEFLAFALLHGTFSFVSYVLYSFAFRFKSKTGRYIPIRFGKN